MTYTPESSVVDWFLELENPGARYLALRDLVKVTPEDKALLEARKAAYAASEPIGVILSKMDPKGFWLEPGAGYYPKYQGTLWSLISLAQLGASTKYDQRIKTACKYYLDNALTEGGQISVNGAPSGTADCMQGNACAALLDLDYSDPRLDTAFEWMARSVTGEGIAPMSEKQAAVRYYAGKCGPNFACGSNNKLPCAWGAAKVMLAFGKLPANKRTPLIERAIQQGIDFLFSVDPATAGYPNGWTQKPSRNWWLFGFPVFYITDLLQIVEALVLLGYGNDSRLKNALELIRNKQDADGCWALEYDYSGKIWFDAGQKKKPNKWVTLRALRVLAATS
jgi:hypothetical protein